MRTKKEKITNQSKLEKMCSICFSPNQQQVILLTNLRQRLYTKFLSESTEDLRQVKKGLNNCLQINSRLLEIVMGQGIASKSSNCNHLKIFNFFKKKLRCSNEVLAALSQEIILKLANRNYQLDIVSQQFMSIPKTIRKIRQEDKIGQLKENKEMIAKETDIKPKNSHQHNVEEIVGKRDSAELIQNHILPSSQIQNKVNHSYADQNNLFYIPYFIPYTL